MRDEREFEICWAEKFPIELSNVPRKVQKAYYKRVVKDKHPNIVSDSPLPVKPAKPAKPAKPIKPIKPTKPTTYIIKDARGEELGYYRISYREGTQKANKRGKEARIC